MKKGKQIFYLFFIISFIIVGVYIDFFATQKPSYWAYIRLIWAALIIFIIFLNYREDKKDSG